MPNKEDISQIRKYLDGELDARAMHALERRAQDDPLLMDALEGYEHAENGQQANLDELGNRLQERTDKKVRRLAAWKPISIAASILIVLGVGMWLITRQQDSTSRLAGTIKSEISEKSAPVHSPPPGNDTALTQKNKDSRVVANQKTAAANAPQFAAAEATSTSTATETADATNAAVEKTGPKRIDTSLFVKKVAVAKSMQKLPADSAKNGYSSADVLTKKPVYAAQPLKSKAEGVTITKQPIQRDKNELYSRGLVPPDQNVGKDINPVKYKQKDTVALNEVVVSGYAAQRKKDISGSVASISPFPTTAGRSIKGKVTDKNDGQPVTGATVKVKGASFGAVTNAEGKFVLNNIGTNQTLVVGFIGYASKNVSINNRDSLNIELTPDNNSLSEVVVTGYAIKQNDSEIAYQDPKPRDGWSAFRKYISENAKSTNGPPGKVRLSFTVDNSGHFSSFKIIKSLGKVADQKAIDLVENGPSWVGATDGKPHEVKVTVKFSPL